MACCTAGVYPREPRAFSVCTCVVVVAMSWVADILLIFGNSHVPASTPVPLSDVCCACRARASVPQPSKMDFVINPGKSSNDPFDAQKVSPGGSAPKNMQSPIGGRLGKVLQQRKRGVRDRMGGVSVEGRGIQL